MLYVGINNAGRQNLGMSALLRVQHPFDPGHQEINDARLAFRGNLSSFGNFPPLFKTASAAGCRCVLSLEDGMSAHRSLPAVVRRIRRRTACADEVGGMAPYRRHAFIRNILSVCRRKPEPRSELRPCKLRERFINSHLSPHNHQPFPMTCHIISFILSVLCAKECVLSPKKIFSKKYIDCENKERIIPRHLTENSFRENT